MYFNYVGFEIGLYVIVSIQYLCFVFLPVEIMMRIRADVVICQIEVKIAKR